ncbi:MAG: right-handed parallel beta-helix repeat-containing protein [Candidatus Bathyarchaeota archaeon]|nr:right-handed parallel beta-helix repeat-containing protein [Candidatus Bathyarchaeota archaeon]
MPEPAIVIQSDGSIDPPCEAITQDGSTYTLNQNITGYTLAVKCNNITLDGAGYTLLGVENSAGIFLQAQNNVTIKNFGICNFTYGILCTWLGYNPGMQLALNNTFVGNSFSNNTYGLYVEDMSTGNRILDNTFTDNTHGIYLKECSENTLRNNRMQNNTYNFYVYSSYMQNSVNDIDQSNTVNGKPIIYLVNQNSASIPADAGYIALVNCTDITVQGFELKGNGQALLLAGVSNVTIKQNTITVNKNGIWLLNSQNNTITANTIADNTYEGIYIKESTNNTITANIFEGNGLNGTQASQVLGLTGRAAIRLYESSNNRITQNVITGNGEGITFHGANSNSIAKNKFNSTQDETLHFFQSTKNLVEENIFTQNNGWTIKVWSSDSNIITQNHIVNNSQGILIDAGEQNQITQNMIANNTGWGMRLESSSNDFMTAANNTITQNNFINNQQEHNFDISIPGIWTYPEGMVAGVPNTWNNETHGNYWSRYTDRYPNATQTAEGTWDTPWVINENNIDHHPLTSPAPISLPDIEPNPTATLQPTSNTSATPQNTANQTPIATPQPLESTALILATAATIAVVAGLLINQKRKTTHDSSKEKLADA